MARFRRRLIVTLFAGMLASLGSVEGGAKENPRDAERTTQDSLKPCREKRTKKQRKKCRQRRKDNGRGQGNCHSSYPDFCIKPPPPDMDCADVGRKGFTVLGSDPHGFDGDNDGVGCET